MKPTKQMLGLVRTLNIFLAVVSGGSAAFADWCVSARSALDLENEILLPLNRCCVLHYQIWLKAPHLILFHIYSYIYKQPNVFIEDVIFFFFLVKLHKSILIAENEKLQVL